MRCCLCVSRLKDRTCFSKKKSLRAYFEKHLLFLTLPPEGKLPHHYISISLGEAPFPIGKSECIKWEADASKAANACGEGLFSRSSWLVQLWVGLSVPAALALTHRPKLYPLQRICLLLGLAKKVPFLASRHVLSTFPSTSPH